MSTSLPFLETVLVWSTPQYVERFSPFICPCHLCPFPSCLQPCEQENVYNVMQSDESWQNWGQLLYELKENSGFTQRCLCPPSRRSLGLSGKNIYDEIHIKAIKSFKCSVLCFQRPELAVTYREQYIGKIIEKFQWGIFQCQFHSVCCYDKNNALLYTIEASLCQCGVFCALNCQPCRQIKFSIKNRDGEAIGSISHVFGGYKVECCSKADSYGIKFPAYTTVEEKILLIMATILIDYQQFENY